ncbi:MAG: carboxypeptidase regulatory-like domain-containing protein [Candidatus Aminicenantia bacterium]
MNKKIFKVLLILCLSIGLTSFATAQIRYGEITGTVVDEDGIPLPGVTVTLESEMVPTRTAVTTEGGVFRFMSLPPASDYKLTCELPGFNTQVREPIKVIVGGTVKYRIAMTVAPIEEEIIVTAETPVVDPKKTGTAVNVTQEILANIPTARDPWVILDQTAGIMVDRVNIGGSQSGQQSQFTARGDSGDNVMWNYDGLTITDQAALGATPTYFDFDAFEEIQITTGGADPSIQTGGIGLNFVTKRGGNKFKGQSYFYRTDAIPFVDFQATNVPSEMEELGYVGDQINMIKDYGFEAGGPLIKDRLWAWGAWGVQDIKMFTAAGTSDDTLLDNLHFKLNAQVTNNDRVELLYFYANKLKWGRGASPNRPLPTTWDQNGPSDQYKIEWEHVFSDNFYMSLKGGFVDLYFELVPKGGLDVMPGLSLDTGNWSDSFVYYYTWRPVYHANLSGNYFLENVLGGDHEWKFGAEYRTGSVRTQYGFAGGGFRLFWSAFGFPNDSALVYLYNDADWKQTYERMSAWIGDTFTTGGLTLNLGVRFDHRINGHAAPEGGINNIPAHAVDPTFLPARRQEEVKKVIEWNDFSPRVGFTYDLTGDGKTLIRGSFARYADQLGSGTAAFGNQAYYAYVAWLWSDDNLDGQPQTSELIGFPSPDWIIDRSPNINPSDPTDYPNIIDSDLSAPITYEGIIGVEREILPDFSVGANFIYRYYKNYTWYPIRNVTSDDWVVAGTVNNAGYEDLFDGKYVEGDYYDLTFPMPPGGLLTNRPDYHQRFWGIEITATKRLSNKWMMNMSFNWNDHRRYYDGPEGYQDPTNIEMQDGEYMAYQMLGSGKAGIFTNARWQFRVNGMYQLPYGFNVSGSLNMRDGYVLPLVLQSPYRDMGTGQVNVNIEPFGSRRLPMFWLFDLRIEKTFRLGDYGTLGLIADVFNVFNNNMYLGREQILNSDDAYIPSECVNPRVFRLGVRFRF